jgi:hypothetical protein
MREIAMTGDEREAMDQLAMYDLVMYYSGCM